MASFIHIADKNDEASIRKNGIRLAKGSRVVYAVPLVPNFSITHQWSRELKARGAKTLICVQFKIPDSEAVWVGRYNQPKLKVTAAEAAEIFMAHTESVGFEAHIRRKILPKEISRTYAAPRVTGWRFYPEAKGRKPFCHCKFCNRGQIRAQRIIRDNGELITD